MQTTRKLQKWAVYLLLFVICQSQSWAQVGPPPIIAVQPVGIAVQNGGTAVFTVVVVSVTKVSYQWFDNGKPVPKATDTILTLKNVGQKDAGSYSVQVKNAAGSLMSSNAVLIIGTDVDPPPPPPPLKIKTGKMTNGGFELQLSGLTNNCVIYASTDMVNWNPIATNAPSAGNVDFTDSKATNKPACYYKAEYQ